MHIPIPLTAQQDEAVIFASMGIRRWRKALVIDLDRAGLTIGWTLQIRQESGWDDIHSTGAALTLGPTWGVSQEHIYYDGPHCFWTVGPLCLFIGDRWDCPRCLPSCTTKKD